MIKQLQKFTVQLFAGANVASVLMMLLVGYSDRLNPVEHPLLSVVGLAFPAFLLVNLCFLFFWLAFKWRMLWIPIGGFLLAYVPITIYFPLNPRQDVPEGALKLISYNVCAYGGNWKYDDGFEHIRDYLKQQQADIVCIQEEQGANQHYIRQEYRKLFPYNDTAIIAESSSSLNIVGLHTRFPIVRRERIDYDSSSNGSVAWWLHVGTDTLIVINNHFESCHLNDEDRAQYKQLLNGKIRGDSARAESKLLLIKLAEANSKRAPQINAVQRYAEEHQTHPVIVCGDFNDNPISYSRHHMAQSLTDCYTHTGRGIGLSYNQKGFNVRIDQVFCSENIQPYNCKIDSKIDASDHYPIVCWLKITPKP